MQATGCLASFVWQCCVSLLVIGRYKQLAERLVIKQKSGLHKYADIESPHKGACLARILTFS